jgi:hypothetical protein
MRPDFKEGGAGTRLDNDFGNRFIVVISLSFSHFSIGDLP